MTKKAKMLSSAMGFLLFSQATLTKMYIFRSILNSNSLSRSDFSFYPPAIVIVFCQRTD